MAGGCFTRRSKNCTALLYAGVQAGRLSSGKSQMKRTGKVEQSIVGRYKADYRFTGGN